MLMKVVCNTVKNLGRIAIELTKKVLGLSVALLPGIIANMLWAFLCGLPLMFCWNVAMPAIFCLPAVSYFQAVCLSFMLSLFLAKNTVTFRKK